MGKRWQFRSHDIGRIELLERQGGVSPVVARLLAARGLTRPEQVRQFLDVKLTDLREPDLLPGAVEAAARILEAVRRKAKIVIYGDYDADGMTATAILLRCLRLIGGEPTYFVPSRLEDGYGLSVEAIDRLAAQSAEMIVTVDCGISSLEEARRARHHGIELIVTDHHEPGPELPEAAGVVHPRLPGHSYPFGGLCGAGVAFKLAWELCKQSERAQKVSQRLKNFLLEAIGLAAIGTVADVVPLLDENRVIVRYGLEIGLKQRPTPGLAALLKINELDQKSSLSCGDVGFKLAPNLNAAGRLGQAQLGVELLATDSPERAAQIAEYIFELNKNRQTLENKVYRAASIMAKEQFDPKNDSALVLAGRDWHPGVIGIVAGRLAEKYHLPVIVISLDSLGAKPGIGSGRSVGSFNLHEALRACGEHLTTSGGHAAAAGLTIDETLIDRFRDDFRDFVSAEILPEDRVAELYIDAETNLSELTLRAVEQIEQLAPFGVGNPRPLFYASNLSLVEPPKRMGNGEKHLSVRFKQFGTMIRAVGFSQGERADEMAAIAGPIEAVFRPDINEYRGMRSVQLLLEDWRAAGQVVSVASA